MKIKNKKGVWLERVNVLQGLKNQFKMVKTTATHYKKTGELGRLEKCFYKTTS